MTKTTIYSARDIYAIAKFHRRLVRIAFGSSLLVSALIAIYVMVGMLVFVVPVDPPISLPQGGQLALATFTTISCSILAVFWLIAFVRLLAALHMRVVVRTLAIAGSFVPVLSMIVLMLVLRRARRVLQQFRYRVGTLGMSRQTLGELKLKTVPPPPPDVV